MAAFRLSKWYLDSVTESGETLIAYTGAVEWRAVRLPYSSVLRASIPHGVALCHTLRAQKEPEVKQGSILWRSQELQVHGLWQSDDPTFRETIFSCEQGLVEWHCLMPRARVQVGDQAGFGYAEHLLVTVPPWKLPIKNLRWGRFANSSDWIVWIDWEGEFSWRRVYVNGEAVTPAVLKDSRIEFYNGAGLTLDRSLTLREGTLGTAALSAIPGIRSTFPARLLGISERKWRSRARLERKGERAVEGWAIHEVVRWPK